MNYYIKALSTDYADFKDRARRKEYWMFVLFNMLAGLVISIIASLTNLTFLPSIYLLATFIPTFSIIWRRLHDIGKSGAWFLISFIPIIGWIWILVLVCLEGTPGANQYGPNPKGI